MINTKHYINHYEKNHFTNDHNTKIRKKRTKTKKNSNKKTKEPINTALLRIQTKSWS